MTYDQLIYSLSHDINFSFSRWGDGEFNCILQNRPGKANCDGHQYFSDMGEALLRIVESAPKYWMGIQPLANRLYPEMGLRLMSNGSKWINADILHNASIHRKLYRFTDAIKGRSVTYVGSDKRIADLYGWAFCQIPAVDCWLSKDRVLNNIRYGLSWQKDAVILFSASMAANYMVDQLYKEYGEKHTFIDVGSVFDPYVGKATRKYHQQIIDREHSRSNQIS